MIEGIGIFLILVVLYTLASSRLSRFSITMPMVFVVVGILTTLPLLQRINILATSTEVEKLTEITLALLLFADASTLDFREVIRENRLPARLLGIGMPLTILLGAALAFLFFPQQGIWYAFLVAAILAPTDAALGLPIFNNTRVPVRIRQSLNVESGLNDGIATPFVTLFIALTIAEEGKMQISGAFSMALIEILIAVGVGVAIGWVGGQLFRIASEHHWSGSTAEQIGNLALALAAYFVSLRLGGNGFIAAFTAGLLFGHATNHRLHASTEYTETSGTFLSLLVWTVFGANLVTILFIQFNPIALLYAVLSLTIIRMLPVAISMVRKQFRLDTVLLMGWLGPRGLASVIFTLLAFDSLREAGLPHEPLFQVAGWTIFLSVMLHGITAVPLASWYANRLASADPSIPELVEVPEINTRNNKQIGIVHSQDRPAVHPPSTPTA